jgi:antitoxin CptB
MSINKTPAHLRWACRRGMLELDILLGKFLESGYLNLTENEKSLFEALLACSDQDLFDWLTGKKISNYPKINFMVDKIRQHAKQSH